ncbi:MAG: cytochrome c, partial [Dehalococcoidia bacterium]|nr:cytochrome c [Dehalococcoidia bacterium]
TGAVILERSEESQGGASLRVWLILHPRPSALALRVKHRSPILRSDRVTKSVYFRGIGKFELYNNRFLSTLSGSIRVFLFLSIMVTISVFIFSGCSTGAYPVDVFPEGHYQQSFRSQEPPRLQPPTDSVPITGKEVTYNFSEAGNLMNPVSPSNELMAKANQLYQVNCAVCHGASGRGDGPMTSYFQQSGAPPPIDYVSPRVKSRKEGELFWIITNGLGTMPRFGPLLTAEERWALVHFVRSVSVSGQ